MPETAKPNSTQAPRRKRGRGADPDETKQALRRAAASSLIEQGFAGTTARSIATRADRNQASIYYHFGGIEQLLITALRHSSEERLDRYRSTIDAGAGLGKLVQDLESLYEQDRESGHLRLLTELVGGLTASPQLREGLEEATKPWLAFVETQIRQAAKSIDYAALLPTADLADLVFSIILGIELRNNIDGNTERTQRLFRLASVAANLLEHDRGHIGGLSGV